MQIRRQRSWDDLMNDPHTPFQIGRLIGANEMAVILLSQAPPVEDVQKIAVALDRSVAFFMEKVPNVPKGVPITSEPRKA